MSEANLNDSDISGSDSPISHSKKQNDNTLDSPQQTHPTYLSRPKANNQVRMQASPVLSPILTKEKHILSHTFNNSKRGQTEEKVNRTLALMHKGLCKLPSHISEKLSSLRIVDLSHNKFEYFPIEVTQVSTLQILRLNFNRIKKLPAEISKLTSLEILSLSYNRLQSLPSTLPQLPALKGLHLESNYIESFGEEITGIKTLECLNIYHNRITGLPTNFKNLKRLRELRLEWLRYLGSTSCYWREDDNATGLNLLRESCEELWKNGRQTVDFIEFLKIFKDNSGEELDIMHRDNYGCTILHQACLCEDIGVIKSLTSVAPDLIDLQDYQNRTPLCYSIVKDKHKASAYLLRHGANPTKQCGADGYPIHIAAKRLNCEILRGILRLGEKVNRTDSEGNTALHHAIALLSEEPKKASQVIEELMDYGADPNIKNNEGWTPLHAAVRKRDTKALEWALSHNFATMEICGRSEVFDLNIGGGPHNWTPMHIAAYSENPEMIEVLGEAGADMFQKSLNGYTPKKVVGKPGLILKLVTKYEREFIKKQILEPHAKQTMSDSGSRERIPTQLVSNLQGTKPVNNVSRNLFAKNLESEDTNTAHEQPDLSIISTNNNTKNFVTPLVSPFHHHSKHISTGCTPFGADTRINMHVTMTETKHLLIRRDSEDSSEILPESEILSVSPSIDELDASHPDFCGSEFNETEKTGSRTQIESDNRKILPTKNIKNKLSETLARITIRCDITNSQSSSQETLKEPSNGPVLPSEIVDSQKYANYLKYCAKSGLDFWDKQARYIEEGVLKESSSLAERLRLLSVFKVFQRSLVDYVKNNPELLSSRRNSIFSVPDRPPSFLENEFFTPVKREVSKEERYLDLPFKSLVNMFNKLKNELPANVSLKIHICRFIGDAKMTKGLEFLKGITRNTQEASLVINEAKIICKMLEGPVKPMDTEGSFIIKGFRTDLFSNQKEAPQGRNVIFSAGKGISTQGKRSSLMAIGNHQGDKGYY